MPPPRRDRRLLLLMLAALVLALVATGALLALLGSLIWTRNLEVRSDGDAVIELRDAAPDAVVGPAPQTPPSLDEDPGGTPRGPD